MTRVTKLYKGKGGWVTVRFVPINGTNYWDYFHLHSSAFFGRLMNSVVEDITINYVQLEPVVHVILKR